MISLKVNQIVSLIFQPSLDFTFASAAPPRISYDLLPDYYSSIYNSVLLIIHTSGFDVASLSPSLVIESGDVL